MKAEANQQKCCDKFEKISETAREELASLKTRRIQHFRKNLVDLTELELKHAKVWHVNKLVNSIWGMWAICLKQFESCGVVFMLQAQVQLLRSVISTLKDDEAQQQTASA